MFDSHLRIVLRSVGRNKLFTLINLLGLGLGLSCSILILLWIRDELRYDAFHEHGNRLYRVMENQFYTDRELQTTHATPGILAEALKNEVPEISHSVQTTWEIQELVTVGSESHKENGRYCTPDMLEMFSFPLVLGNASTALSSPTKIAITEKLAARYFPNENPMGKLVRINNQRDFEVSGVLRNVPENSSLQFDFLLPFEVWAKNNEWIKFWNNTGPRTFVMLREDANRQTVEGKIKDFIKHKSPDANVELILQPYEDMYLHSKFKAGKPDGGRIEYIRSFSVVALVVLVIACINFMNLATARSLTRAKEIGVRKVSGAMRKTLIAQFMGESVLFSMASIVFALMTVEILLPAFRTITDKKLVVDYSDPSLVALLVGIGLLTGIISGTYPALFLSSFNVVKVLKGNLRFNRGAISMRKGLVVFQFCLTIVLIFCTLVVYRQIQFIKNKNLGFQKENLILIALEGDLKQKVGTVVNETMRLDGIVSATVSTTSPLLSGNSTLAVEWPGKDADEKILFTQMAVGYDYLKTMGIGLAEGRDFSRDFPADSAAYIVNEESVRRMQLKAPLGQPITFWERPGRIVGVTKDYHINSLHAPIEPVILHLHPEWSNLMIARAEAGKTSQALEGLKKTMAELNPGYPFEYHFVDETFEKQYKGETTVGKLAGYFSGLAIFISCLGLTGLILFTAQQRIREIGVRKVLGASVAQIIALLSADFLLLVVVAMVIALPTGWYLMSDWLHNFEFRVDVGWQVFLISGLASMGIAGATLAAFGLRAAASNPVESLRTE